MAAAIPNDWKKIPVAQLNDYLRTIGTNAKRVPNGKSVSYHFKANDRPIAIKLNRAKATAHVPLDVHDVMQKLLKTTYIWQTRDGVIDPRRKFCQK